MLAIFDYDSLIYAAGFVNETRTIKAIHKASGREKVFKNRTEFWGAGKKIGGWLSDLNEERKCDNQKIFTKEDFIVEDVQEAGPLANTLQLVKTMINGTLNHLGAEQYQGFVGKGDSFRLERSTMLKYKGNREHAIRPLHKAQIIEYMVKHQSATVVEGLEADDWVVIEGLRNPGSVVVSDDKDAAGCPIMVYNAGKPELGIRNGNQFGELLPKYKETRAGTQSLDSVKGIGRKFFYYQVLWGDPTDNYRSNAGSELEFGQVAAYSALKDAKNDLEALEVIRDTYKRLYPSPREITGWRGDTILVDWEYALNEIWDMARMRRTPDDIVIGTDVLKKFKLM
jgi:hypothetical protein